MEHMNEKELVAEHKVQVTAHTLILAQPYPTSRKGTLLQACEREYWNLIVQIRQSAPLFLWYNIPPVMHNKTTLRHKYAHTTFVFTDMYLSVWRQRVGGSYRQTE